LLWIACRYGTPCCHLKRSWYLIKVFLGLPYSTMTKSEDLQRFVLIKKGII
jgi:hypothetical protein